MNSKNFTFGVEIEGLFTREILETLTKYGDVDLQCDGSVRTQAIYSEKLNGLSVDINDDVQEISVGIFKKQTDLMKVLRLVQADKNHFFNESCGLHLHIKPKRNREMVEARIADGNFLEKIQKFAYTQLCQHIKEREGNHYCQSYKDLRHTVYDWRAKEKYRFIRPHQEHKTLEMRFFSPCEHKVENVTKFLEYFSHELRDVKPIKEDIIGLEDQKQTQIALRYTLETANVSINQEHGINLFTRKTNKRRHDSIFTQINNDYERLLRRVRPRGLHADDCHCDEDCVRLRADDDCECDTCDDFRANN